MKYDIRGASSGDIEAISSLLAQLDLPLAGVEQHLRDFFVAVTRKDVVGTGGVEIYGTEGLLRSVAVAPSLQGKGVGMALASRALAHARERSVESVYLLTATAEGYFKKLGFAPIDREAVPGAVRESAEFTHACPETAICMYKRLSVTPLSPAFYTSGDLRLEEVAPKTKMWDVRLENVQLTYFELAPGCVIPTHSHENEQITMVLEGSLTITVEGQTRTLEPGDVVAIPSMATHSARCVKGSCRVVDAWSPVRESFKIRDLEGTAL